MKIDVGEFVRVVKGPMKGKIGLVMAGEGMYRRCRFNGDVYEGGKGGHSDVQMHVNELSVVERVSEAEPVVAEPGGGGGGGGGGGDEMMKLIEVAALFRVCRHTVMGWVAKGEFPEPVKIGRSVRFRREEVERMMGKTR